MAMMAMGVLQSGPADAATCSGWAAVFGGCKPPTTTPTTTAAAPAPAPAPAPVTYAPAAPSAPAAFNPDAAAARLVELSNAERAAAGLVPLTQRADVVAIAHDWSVAMATAGAISHNADYLTTATRTALGARLMGENVGVGGNIDQVHEAFMDSPHHRENIMEPDFSIVGYAVVQSADGNLYMTQDFVQPSGAAPRAAAAPRRPAAASVSHTARLARPRPAVAAPTTTVDPVPETTTTVVVPADPPPSVLASAALTPTAAAPLNPTHANGNRGLELAALVMLAATATLVGRYSSRRSAEMNAS
jgi:uncharacterized protein YkwD